MTFTIEYVAFYSKPAKEREPEKLDTDSVEDVRSYVVAQYKETKDFDFCNVSDDEGNKYEVNTDGSIIRV